MVCTKCWVGQLSDGMERWDNSWEIMVNGLLPSQSYQVSLTRHVTSVRYQFTRGACWASERRFHVGALPSAGGSLLGNTAFTSKSCGYPKTHTVRQPMIVSFSSLKLKCLLCGSNIGFHQGDWARLLKIKHTEKKKLTSTSCKNIRFCSSGPLKSRR